MALSLTILAGLGAVSVLGTVIIATLIGLHWLADCLRAKRHTPIYGYHWDSRDKYGSRNGEPRSNVRKVNP